MNSSEFRGLTLQFYPPPERPLAGTDLQEISGGLSGGRLWRFIAPAGTRALRLWPAAARPAQVTAIHHWLASAHDLPWIPTPIRGSNGSTFQEVEGRLWELSPWLVGSTDLARPPAIAHVRAAFSGLAKFHLRLADSERLTARSPGLTVRRQELENLTLGGFDIIETRLDGAADDPLTPSAREWLRLARQTARFILESTSRSAAQPLSLQPCIRDARAEHFLFVDETLTGLVDFGAMDLETVAADLARLMGEWFPGEEFRSIRETGLAEYQRIRPLAINEIAAAAAFESLADLLIAERWIRWRLLEDRTFHDHQAFADGLERGLSRIRRLAKRLGTDG